MSFLIKDPYGGAQLSLLLGLERHIDMSTAWISHSACARVVHAFANSLERMKPIFERSCVPSDSIHVC